jgi:hypothetical protein
MTFLYPSFLWALGVLAIPVIIHLFNFRKTTRVFFSNNRFLKHVKESTTAKRKLKHYLILASRLLFLLFLVFAFCQPIIPAREQTVNYRNIIFYLDNSQSMSAPLPDQRRGLDAGISFISEIVGVFPADARYKLITNDFAPYSNSYKSKKEIFDLLAQVRLSPVSRTVKEITSSINRGGSARDQEIFWVSDFQKSTAGKPDAYADTSRKWHLVPISFNRLSNVFVDTAYLDNPFASSGEKNVIRIKVRNDGTEDIGKLSVKLMINSVQMGATAIDVPKGGISEAAFDLTTRLTGLNKATITFNDFPVSFDNEFYFTLNYNEKIRILEIKNTAAPTPIEKVFGNTQVFSHRSFSISNFNYSLLNDADLVVVNGLNSIDASLNLALREYIRKNGTLLFIPGREPEVNSIKAFLQVPMLGRAQSQGLQELDKPDFSNPFFQNVFEEKSSGIIMPKANPVIDWGSDRSAILKFKNEKPFLSRFDQAGKVYLLSSPLETTHTDFYNHGLFVPVMYRLAASSRKNEQKLYYSLPETFLILRMDSVPAEEQIRLVSQEEIIPSQRRTGNDVLLDLPKFALKTGFYSVVSARDTVDLLAFNAGKEESLMEQFKGDEIKRFFGEGDNVTIFSAQNTDTFSNEIKERYLGTPLWKYAILLALMFLAAEVLLIRFMK